MSPDELETAAETLRWRLHRDALLRAEGEPDLAEVWAAAMGDWLAMLDAAPDRDSEIGKELFALAAEGQAPAPEALRPMYAFWDAIDLARDGRYGSLEEERGKLREFLARWSRPEASLSPLAVVPGGAAERRR